MDTRFGWRNIGKVFILLGSIVISVYSILGDAFNLPVLPDELNVWVLPIGIMLFLIVILWHFMDLQLALTDRRPNIILEQDPIPYDVLAGKQQDTIFSPTSAFNFVSISFSNRPKTRTNQNHAQKLRAEITFLDENNKPLFDTIQGRWSQMEHAPKVSKSQIEEIESITLPNNGGARSVDLLIKYPEDEFCFAYNNTAYNYQFFTNPNLQIKKKRFFVRLVLMAEYMINKTWEFEVITNGIGDTFKIRKKGSTKWLKTENSQATKTLESQVKKVQKKKSSPKKTSSKKRL